ncbi:hypothetical protein, partial [Neisseria sp.]
CSRRSVGHTHPHLSVICVVKERPPPVQPCSEEGELYTTPHLTVNSRQTKITAQNPNPLPNNRIFFEKPIPQIENGVEKLSHQ